MTDCNKDFNARIKKAELSAGKDDIIISSLQKSDLPGVVETASLGELRKPKPSK